MGLSRSRAHIWSKVIFVIASAFTLVTSEIVPAGSAVSWPYQRYKTVDLTPPYLNITQYAKPSEGYLFFAPDGATPVQIAPVIMDMDGELIWNGPNASHAFAFGVYQYKNMPVLAWWNGCGVVESRMAKIIFANLCCIRTLFPEPIGRGNGVIHLYNNNYESIQTVTLPGNFLELEPAVTYPSNIDVHELLITEKESLLVTANNVTQADLSSVGGPSDGWVVEAQIYEIDIATNEVLFSWRSLDHLDDIPFNASFYTLGTEGYTGVNQSLAWGYFHINSVEPYDTGYILSSRYLCSAIAIDGSGNVKWRLSGREGGDFKLMGHDSTTGFCYQHDIRVEHESATGVSLRMHDNHNSPIENYTVPSTAKVVHLDFESKEATLLSRVFNHSGPIFATAQGNFQPLSDGNVFVGHGWVPVMEEFSSSGDTLTTIQFGAAQPKPGGGFLSAVAPTLSYRDFKQHWVGCPVSKPEVVAENSGGKVIVYVSWNGATELEAWEIYGGSSEAGLKLLTTVPKRGFETKASVKSVEYVQVKPILKHNCECRNAPSSTVIKVA